MVVPNRARILNSVIYQTQHFIVKRPCEAKKEKDSLFGMPGELPEWRESIQSVTVQLTFEFGPYTNYCRSCKYTFLHVSRS